MYWNGNGEYLLVKDTAIYRGLEQVSIIQRVSLIHSVLYERFHCISMGLEQVSIIQRVSLIHSVLYEGCHCISMGLEQVSIIQRVSLIHSVLYEGISMGQYSGVLYERFISVRLFLQS